MSSMEIRFPVGITYDGPVELVGDCKGQPCPFWLLCNRTGELPRYFENQLDAMRLEVSNCFMQRQPKDSTTREKRACGYSWAKLDLFRGLDYE